MMESMARALGVICPKRGCKRKQGVPCWGSGPSAGVHPVRVAKAESNRQTNARRKTNVKKKRRLEESRNGRLY